MAHQTPYPQQVHCTLALAARLAELRMELFGPQGGREIAQRLGIPTQTWSNYDAGVTVPGVIILKLIELTVSGDTNSDPLRPVLNPTPSMLACYRFLPPFSGPFPVFTSGSRWVCSRSAVANLDRINPLLRFSRKR
jgi:hypothetical protein